MKVERLGKNIHKLSLEGNVVKIAILSDIHWDNPKCDRELLKKNLDYCLENNIKEILVDAGIPFSSDDSSFAEMEVGITNCEFLIARLGSILVSSGQTSGRRLFVFPPSHIVLADSSQLVPDIKHALKALKEKYKNHLPSMISIITGPSRTADIEKTLVMGAHGPKNLYLFLLDIE